MSSGNVPAHIDPSAPSPQDSEGLALLDHRLRHTALAFMAMRYNRSNPVYFCEQINNEFSLYCLSHDSHSTFGKTPDSIQKIDISNSSDLSEQINQLEYLFSFSHSEASDPIENLPPSETPFQGKSIQFLLDSENLTLSPKLGLQPTDPSPQQFLEHLQNALRLARSSSNAVFAKTPIQSPAEFETQVHHWNSQRHETETGRFGFERIDDVADLYPDTIAVETDGTSLTYAALVDRANRFAHYLKENSVGPNTIVCVYMQRSIELVLALVGIQKAGGAFLLIDPLLPQDRINTLLAHSQTKHIVALSSELPRIENKQVNIYKIDQLDATLKSQPSHPPKITLTENDLSCVFYTSGSTGEPKGVAMGVQYRGISDKPLEELFPDRGKRSLLKSSTGFTLILHEVFSTLQSGGRLLVVPSGLEKDMGWLADTISQRKISSVSFAPSLLSLILEEPAIAKCDCIESVFTVGETLPLSTQQDFYKKLPQAKLLLFYGCTEAPALTLRTIDPEEDFDGKIIIGKPLSNKKIYLLDEYEIPVPIGASGEIYGGGDLSLGYIGNEELTQQKFRPDPFDSTEGARCYQTGDLARYLPDGNIEFLGRSDFQVQIRGIRIELSEIETAIDQHPAVKKSVVITQGDAGEVQLLAYYTFQNAAPPDHEIRALLRTSLPEYMIPQHFTPLAEFPLTPSGKLDRKALPAPQEKSQRSRRLISPTNSIQVKLELIFKQVLKTDRLSIDDDFFESGGDSFLAVKALSRINQSFNTKLEIPDLYRNRDIISLEKVVAQKGYKSPYKFLVELNDASSETTQNLFIFGCSPTIKPHLESSLKINLMRSLWFDRNYDYSDTLESVTREYATDIQKAQAQGPYLLAGYSMGALLAHTFATQCQNAGQQVRTLHLIDPATPPANPAKPSVSNLQHLLRHLFTHHIKDQRAFAFAQLINLLRIPIPYKFQSRAAWFYIANLLETSNPQAFEGDAILYLRKNYQEPNLERWKTLIKGSIEIVRLPVETHAAVDEPKTQKLWCDHIIQNAN